MPHSASIQWRGAEPRRPKMRRGPLLRLSFAIVLELFFFAALNLFDDWTLELMPVKFVAAAFLSGISYWIAASNFPPKDGFAAANKIDMRTRQQAVLFFAVAIALRVIALPLAPSDDLWRYEWEGKIQRAGFNPYLVAPDDPKLDALRRSFPESSKINHPNVRASFAPGAEILFRFFS
ncbi:MAG: hypothetical protein DMF25_08275, partial [Verrucomicrobia bacterium]